MCQALNHFTQLPLSLNNTSLILRKGQKISENKETKNKNDQKERQRRENNFMSFDCGNASTRVSSSRIEVNKASKSSSELFPSDLDIQKREE